MLSRTLLSVVPLLLGIISPSNAALELKMARYEVPSDAPQKDKDNAVNKPTFFAQYSAESHGLDNPESYQTNLALAKAHFDWLTNPQNKPGRTYGDSGWLTIAVMYDPAWYGAAKREGQPIEIHAEDGVYFNYEISDKAHVSTDAGKKPYPEGTIVASYGHHLREGKNLFGPDKLPACSSSRKNPSCQEVAKALGVQFQKDPPAAAEQASDAAVTETDNPFEGMSEEQINELLCTEDMDIDPKRRSVAIKGREVQLDRRASCKKPYPISTFSYSKTHQPKPSCYQQNEDPDQGINTEYCVCEKSRTLPFLTISPTVVRTKSCEYTTLPPKDDKRDLFVAPRTEAPSITAPASMITPAPSLDERDLTIHTGFDSTSTDKKHCLVCSRVVNNENACSSMKNCIVQTGKVTIEAGTSSVHVGTLTGKQLYTSVSSALDEICPTPTKSGFTSCKTDTVSIGDIPYVHGGFLSHEGELQISVESSSYNMSSIRTALIKAAAAAAQNAATGKNCYKQDYDISQIIPRSWTSWLPGFMRRGDIMPPQQGSDTWCNTVGFSGPHYYNPWWSLQAEPGASDYMDVHFEFHEDGGGDFDCAILEGAAGALAFLGPEFAIGDIGLEEAIGIVCEGASQERRDLNSTLLDMP
ncbi:hypothetical protein GGR52DRAFT_586712 [Hypoxylon sp. FL1284]|nr:hypothetical protein GGR52DRAFT_586712 [Hypoxylon sp. FL1284]